MLSSNSLQVKQIGRWNLMDGSIGNGSYGLVRLAYKDQETPRSKTEQEYLHEEEEEEEEDDDVTPPTTPKNNEYQKKYFAVKIFDSLFHKKKELAIRNEVSIVKYLSKHPNILRFHDVVQEGNMFGIVTEYASGGDLHDFILANTRLPENLAQHLFTQVLSAVEYAHKNFIVHRDLKAENIFLTSDLQVRVGDWGLSSSFSPRRTLIQECGSVHYASPEVINGSTYVGPEIDVWSLGVLLYVMTTGTFPFYGDNIKQTISRGIFTCPDYLSSPLVKLIRWMLQPKPTNRCKISDIQSHPWMRPTRQIPRFMSYRNRQFFEEDRKMNEEVVIENLDKVVAQQVTSPRSRVGTKPKRKHLLDQLVGKVKGVVNHLVTNGGSSHSTNGHVHA